MHFKHFAQKSTFVSWCFQTYHGFKENISHELNINASCCDNFVMPPFVFEVMLAVTDFILKLKHPLYFCCCCCCCLSWLILERFEISDKKNKTWLPSYRPAQMSVAWSFFPIHTYSRSVWYELKCFILWWMLCIFPPYFTTHPCICFHCRLHERTAQLFLKWWMNNCISILPSLNKWVKVVEMRKGTSEIRWHFLWEVG